jgi:hypothetical protein
MARPGLSKLEVKHACDALAAQGRYPSADAVRRELGDRGSKSTIHRLLKQLQAEALGPVSAIVQPDAYLRHAFDDLLARVRADHADQLRRQALQIAYLSEQVQSLQRRLRMAEDDSAHVLSPGFGDPYGLNDNNRAGRAGFSRIDSFFNSRSSSTSKASQGQNGSDPFWRI